MITVAYTNVGRHKGCKAIEINIPKNSVKEMKEMSVANRAREFLMSRDVSSIEYKKNKFKIYAGFQKVGDAEII